MAHAIVATYFCHRRYGGTYPCSAFSYYLTWLWIPVVVVLGLFGSHRGYRYRQNRRARSVEGEEAVAGPALVAQARREAGLPPEQGPGPLPAGAGGGVAGRNVVPGAPAGPPPAWYPDPEHPGRRRYWSGTAWAPAERGPGGPPGPSGPAEDLPGWGAAR